MIPGFGKTLTPLKQAVGHLEDKSDKFVRLSPLFGASRSLFLRKISPRFGHILVLLPDAQQVAESATEMRLSDPDRPVMEIASLKPDELREKITALQSLQRCIVYAVYDILFAGVPDKKHHEDNLLRISFDDNPGYEGMNEYFNEFVYTRQKFVEAKGEFSRRGAIIDFWSWSENSPVRIEFDGDFIESIRYFDPESQRSTSIAEVVTLAGPIDEELNAPQIPFTGYLNNPLVLLRGEELAQVNPGFSEIPASAQVTVVFDEETDIPVEAITESNAAPLVEREITLLRPEDIFTNFNGSIIIEEPLSGTRFETGLKQPPAIHSNYKTLTRVIEEYIQKEFTILISAENDIQKKRLEDIIGGLHDDFESLLDEAKLRIITWPVKQGFVSADDKLLLLTDYEIFAKPYRTKVSSKQIKKKGKGRDLSSLVIGDFVVHEDFGIARYQGLETIKVGDSEFESIKLIYKNGGTVYVNLNYLNKVKKYSAAEGAVPQLSTLGGTEWVSAKKKAKKRIKEAARELILLYARRKSSKGYSFSADSIWQNELEASFIYEDTPDQSKVTEEVKTDMMSQSPMDRLVCGDVGFGKTEIAVRAAFKAVQDQKQVAVLVPTTILAEQHFNTFRDRLQQFPVRVEQMSRFMTKQQNTLVSKGLKEGSVDIVIGTHRILSKDVQFKDIGLLIIDEEHRFGVTAKEKLKSVKTNLDTLTLTATPIPRTLNLSLLGARDLSLVTTPPPNRQPIYTKIEVFDIHKIKDWVNHELSRGGQVYIVHDRVRSIENFAAYLLRYMPELKIGIAHGQMKPADLEEVIHKFLNREYKVLISTKIIESGIDIPNVNTMIVNRADRFGLAELHQLRGRVGRSDRQAYAYFLVPSKEALNGKSLKRLQAVEEYSDIGAGFNLAMRDLEIRGAGNLLGTEQSGTINEVGFDLYIKLINEAVEELKAEEFREVFKDLPKEERRSDPAVETWFEIGIPNHYIPEQNVRLYFYTGLFSVKTEDELRDFEQELIDRFGKTPIMVNRLLSCALLKLKTSEVLFERINIQRKVIVITLPKGRDDYYEGQFALLMQYINSLTNERCTFKQDKEVLKLIIENRFETPERSIEFLLRFVADVKALYSGQLSAAR